MHKNKRKEKIPSQNYPRNNQTTNPRRTSALECACHLVQRRTGGHYVIDDAYMLAGQVRGDPECLFQVLSPLPGIQSCLQRGFADSAAERATALDTATVGKAARDFPGLVIAAFTQPAVMQRHGNKEVGSCVHGCQSLSQ